MDGVENYLIGGALGSLARVLRALRVLRIGRIGILGFLRLFLLGLGFRFAATVAAVAARAFCN